MSRVLAWPTSSGRRLSRPLRAASIAALAACLLGLAPAAKAQSPYDPAPGPFDFGYLTGTDDLGRVLPQHGEVREPREDRYVGLFYFLWLGQHSRSGPHDITRILAEHPEAVHDVDHPAWGPRGAFHHWGKPLYDYYFSDDAWVLRRHAQLLAAAQVDFLVFDVTNAFTYREVYSKLLDVFDDVRRQGWDVPRVVFYTNSSSGQTISQIYDDLYKPGRHRELWFELDGKPMIIGDPDQVSQEIRDFFTFRRNQWPNEPKKPLGFPWISFERPQDVFYVDGKPDVVNVAVGVHNNFPFSDQPFYGYGENWSRSFHDGRPDPAPDAYVHGYNFAEQWERALAVDPRMVMVTGWNEWVAQRLDGQFPGHDGKERPPDRPIFFVDQATAEYSRDAEPMKGGYNDNYYLQLVDNIRRYKGLGTQAAPSARRSIAMYGSFAQWNDVRPAYRDFVGDTEDRRHAGFGGETYTDETGRNDFELVKVARDVRNVYFYARTAEPLRGVPGRQGPTLLIDADRDGRSGWKGYDYVVNRNGTLGPLTTLEASRGGWSWRGVAPIAYRASGRELHVAIPRALLGRHGRGPLQLEFKWVDNVGLDGDVMNFYVHGDAAPDGRFNYMYTEDRRLLTVSR